MYNLQVEFRAWKNSAKTTSELKLLQTCHN